MKMKNYLKKKNRLRYQKFLVWLKICNYFRNTIEENINQEFRLKYIDETRNYLTEEINQNKLISKKHKNFCTALNYLTAFTTQLVQLSCCSFYSYWICFYLFFCFFSWYCNRNYEFCIRINNLCNNCRN